MTLFAVLVVIRTLVYLEILPDPSGFMERVPGALGGRGPPLKLGKKIDLIFAAEDLRKYIRSALVLSTFYS